MADPEPAAGPEAVIGVYLEGPVARLRPVRVADAARGFALLHGNERLLDGLLYRGPAELSEVEARFASWLLPDPSGDPARTGWLLAVEDRADDAWVGTISLTREGSAFSGRLGYWIDDGRWGRGLATDAVRLLARLATTELGVPALAADVFVGNVASRRVLEKAGFRLEREEPEPAPVPGHGSNPRSSRPLWCLAATAGDVAAAGAAAGWEPVRWTVTRGAPGPG